MSLPPLCVVVLLALAYDVTVFGVTVILALQFAGKVAVAEVPIASKFWV